MVDDMNDEHILKESLWSLYAFIFNWSSCPVGVRVGCYGAFYRPVLLDALGRCDSALPRDRWSSPARHENGVYWTWRATWVVAVSTVPPAYGGFDALCGALPVTSQTAQKRGAPHAVSTLLAGPGRRSFNS